MARLFPAQLSDRFSASRSSAERMVFEKCQRELDGEFRVFHDLSWDDPSLEDSKTAGQIDFVVLHPLRGIICIEVKGGRCSYRADTRTWETVDRDDRRVEIADPFDQARVAARVLVKLLQRQPALKGSFIPAASAVIFPDCNLPRDRTFRADVQRWQILNQDDLFSFGNAIERVLDGAFSRNVLRRDHGLRLVQGMKALFGNRDIEGHSPLASRIRATEERLVQLTEQQMRILDALRLQRRLLIKGCAGSGKTILAVHKARCLAEEGKRVLLTCFNIPLGHHLRQLTSDHEEIIAGPFLELCVNWLPEGDELRARAHDDEWWSSALPSLVADQLNQIPFKFDAIVVDEGQDFKEAHWTLIELLLSDPDGGALFVFADQGQNIYSGWDKYPMMPAPVILDRNVRNTDPVFAIVKPLCPPGVDMLSSGVEGPVPRLVGYSDDSHMLTMIETVLSDLVKESVPIADVVVLGTRAQTRTALTYGTRIGPFTLVSERRDSRDLLAMSIQRFKGLERRAVIVCELDSEQKVDDLLYVAATRSSSLLYILATGAAYARLCRLPFKLSGV